MLTFSSLFELKWIGDLSFMGTWKERNACAIILAFERSYK